MERADASRKVRARLTPALPAIVFVIALAVIAVVVVDRRDEIGTALDQVVWWALPLSWIACVAALLCVFRAWAALVRDAGVEITQRQALRVYATGQVAKYVPGGVWSVAAQAQMVRAFGGSRLRTASASLVILLLGVSVSLAMGSVLLPLSGHEARDRFWYAPFLAVASAIVLVPKVLNRGSVFLARLLRQEAAAPAYTARGVISACGWMAVGNLLFGVHLQAIGAGLGVDGVRGYLLSTAAYSIAASLGLLFIPAPAGAGIRELVLTVVLAPSVSTGGALIVALISRVVGMAADLALATSQLVRPVERQRSPVFVTRRFPPSVGGMETLAAGVWDTMQAARPDAILIAHRGSNRGLLWWLPLAWLKVAWLLVRGRVELVLVGDAPTFAVLEGLLRVARVRRSTMILGLDVTHDGALYRRTVLGALRRAPEVIAISSATRDEAVAHGVAHARVSVLRLGVPVPSVTPAERDRARARLLERFGLAEDDAVLLTLGRLVKRKGSAWFLRDVFGHLPRRTCYLIAGDGPERDEIAAAATDTGVSERVFLLGRVSDDERDELLMGCDLFVQPNIPVAGDMEGFGLVTIEAAMRGALVVASGLEGLKDAVLPGVTGYLVAPHDTDAWIRTITELIESRSMRQTGWDFRGAAIDAYADSVMAQRLQQMLFDQPTQGSQLPSRPN